ncbi:hypothetical protein Xbud_02586 [Xenorhabdus budapestensis]|uniref:Uncharacterized protein n=1 Tax=Xenorhabdus budapestensis TaxID=290110 RepID=A0A2D0IXD3_XENBU|nr:hypothetical protein Xbud_02586 [Xenorhabdus budapestensis]
MVKITTVATGYCFRERGTDGTVISCFFRYSVILNKFAKSLL